MSKTKPVNDYKSISDRQLELMNDSQLITTRNILRSDINSGKVDPEGLIMSDYHRVCVRMAERLERCYTFGCVPGGEEVSGTAAYVSQLKSELAACRDQIAMLCAENRRLSFELTGVEPDLEGSLSAGTDPELPFYYPNDPDDDSDGVSSTVLIV